MKKVNFATPNYFARWEGSRPEKHTRKHCFLPHFKAIHAAALYRTKTARRPVAIRAPRNPQEGGATE